MMITLVVIVQPTSTSLSHLGPDLAPRDHLDPLLTHWEPTFGHLWPQVAAT
jgi:hypothetical protein